MQQGCKKEIMKHATLLMITFSMGPATVLLGVMQGCVTVMVEQRSNATDTFGQGRKSAMQFCDFFNAMKEGNSSLYMSTQQVG